MKLAAWIILVGAIGAPAALGGPVAESARAQSGAAPTQVVIELFTSEGCSSCPPADRILSRLLAEQPLAGVQIIALGEHVDYWDRLGWPDRFASVAYTRRQREYQSHVFASSTVYTPQLVVDGRLERVASREDDVLRAIELAARSPKASVRVTAESTSAGAVPITVDVEADTALVRHGSAEIMLAVVENSLVTRVARGENRGRTLTHDAVVRRLERIGSLSENQSKISLSAQLPIEDEWSRQNIRLIAFVQEDESRRILGASSADIEDTAEIAAGR